MVFLVCIKHFFFDALHVSDMALISPRAMHTCQVCEETGRVIDIGMVVGFTLVSFTK